MTRIERTIELSYLPVEWGVKANGQEIIAWARFKRVDSALADIFYGDDADTYKAFEEAGFTLSKKVNTFTEADEWIKKEVLED